MAPFAPDIVEDLLPPSISLQQRVLPFRVISSGGEQQTVLLTDQAITDELRGLMEFILGDDAMPVRQLREFPGFRVAFDTYLRRYREFFDQLRKVRAEAEVGLDM
jgi:hypothetical protein